MLNKNPYTWAGLGLLITGGLASLSSYFILLTTWITALGMCMLILSFILIALGRTIPKLPPEVCGLLLETGIDNIATIVEELGIKAKAIYLPSSLTNGQPKALIPLHTGTSLAPINTVLPQRLIVKYGTDPDDIGLLLSTFGSAAVGMLESRPDPSEFESALTSLFTGILGAADRTRVLHHENHITVEIHNSRIESKATWSHQCLGEPLSSIVASVAAEAWNRPVTIKQEEHHRRKYSIELEVVG